MRKFGFDRNGVSIGTSKAMAQGKIACGRLGFTFLPDARIGAVVGHFIEIIEELELRIKDLESRAQPSTSELVDVRSLPVSLPHSNASGGEDPPEHLRGDYRKMNGEQRRELKEWRAQHAA